MEEKWKDIEGYEDIYEVSSKGRVKTKEGKTTYSDLHGKRTWKARVLKQKTDKDGYKRVTLWKNKRGKDFLVHRLVATAFLSNPESKPTVNHIDGNPSNNYLNNIEWATYRENLLHAFKNGLNKSPDPIILQNVNTNELQYFGSKAEASEFLGRSKGYVSARVNAGEFVIDEYQIFVTKRERKDTEAIVNE